MQQAIKSQALRRLKILEGQVRGLQEMVEKDKYCVDILRQSAAVKQALSGVEDLILENHLNEHVISQIQQGKANKAIQEIMAVYKTSKRK